MQIFQILKPTYAETLLSFKGNSACICLHISALPYLTETSWDRMMLIQRLILHMEHRKHLTNGKD
jgi:hypothetical protein